MSRAIAQSRTRSEIRVESSPPVGPSSADARSSTAGVRMLMWKVNASAAYWPLRSTDSLACGVIAARSQLQARQPILALVLTAIASRRKTPASATATRSSGDLKVGGSVAVDPNDPLGRADDRDGRER